MFRSLVAVSTSSLARKKTSKRTGLLVGSPKCVGDFFGPCTATNCNRLAVRSDFDLVQLAEINLNTMVHATQSGDGSMSSVVGEERKALGVGIFDLEKQSLAFLIND